MADRLAPIDAATMPEEPPARVWRGIARGLALDASASAPAQGWFCSLAFWRAWGIAASAAAAGLIIYVAAFSGRTAPPIPTVVAVLADQNGDPNWIAITGPQRGEVSVSAVRPQGEDAHHSFELWSIAGGTPHPLGLLQTQSGSVRILRATQLPPPGDLLAVSLEPPGGSPTGLPTGPVLSHGKVLFRPP